MEESTQFMYEIDNVCVTGGAGFIGSHLVERLVREGHNVVVLDDLSSGSLDNLASVMSDIAFVEGSVTNQDVVRSVLRDVDTVFHLASRVSVPESFSEPKLYSEVIVDGAKNVGSSAGTRIIQASSCSVYGDPTEIPTSENCPAFPSSPYAFCKYLAETFSDTSLRFFNVFGPRQSHDSPYSGIIAKMAHWASTGSPPVIYGDGNQTRDFISVYDVVDVLIHVSSMNTPPKVLNVGTGQETSILELWSIFEEVYDISKEPTFYAARDEIRRSVADISALKESLGRAPKVSLKTGISDMFGVSNV
jgi:UDP-glucose 4-epimerase